MSQWSALRVDLIANSVTALRSLPMYRGGYESDEIALDIHGKRVLAYCMICISVTNLLLHSEVEVGGACEYYFQFRKLVIYIFNLLAQDGYLYTSSRKTFSSFQIKLFSQFTKCMFGEIQTIQACV